MTEMKQDVSIRNLFALMLGLTFYLGEGINYSQLGPFFPTEATQKHGISTTAVGLITSSFDVANFFGVFLLTRLINAHNQKFFFCVGALLSSSSNALFGAMGWTEGGGWPFIFVCILDRAVMGLGCCMIWSTGLALLIPLFPQWGGKIVSIIQCVLGLGQMIGPSFGSALYSLGGYPLPFFVSGGIEFVFSFLCMAFLPNTALEMMTKPQPPQQPAPLKTIKESDDGSYEEQSCSEDENQGLIQKESKTEDNQEDSDDEEHGERGFGYFVSRPILICASIPLILQSSSIGFIEVAVGPYLDNYFGIDGNTSGYYFLVFSATYALGSPVIGTLVDMGHGGKIFVSSAFFAGLGFVMMFVPWLIHDLEHTYWLLIWLGVEGLAGAGCFVTAQLVFESIAFAVGFDDANKIKIMTSGCSCAGYSLGRIAGPILTGGIFMQNFGYYYSCLLQGALLIVASIFGFVVCLKHGLLAKIYYHRGEEDDIVPQVFVPFYQSMSVSTSMAVNRSGRDSTAAGRSLRNSVNESNSIFVLQSTRHNQLISISFSQRQGNR